MVAAQAAGGSRPGLEFLGSPIAAMPQDRLDLLLQYHREDPADAFTRFALAQEYAKRGEHARACMFYEELVVSRPDYTGAYLHLGNLYLVMGRLEDAVAIYERGVVAARGAGRAKDLSELQDALLQLT